MESRLYEVEPEEAYTLTQVPSLSCWSGTPENIGYLNEASNTTLSSTKFFANQPGFLEKGAQFCAVLFGQESGGCTGRQSVRILHYNISSLIVLEISGMASSMSLLSVHIL